MNHGAFYESCQVSLTSKLLYTTQHFHILNSFSLRLDATLTQLVLALLVNMHLYLVRNTFYLHSAYRQEHTGAGR